MTQKTKMSTEELHLVLINALEDKIISFSNVAEKPLSINCKLPLPRKLKIYLFNLTNPPGGRTIGEHKIQLIVPGQKKGEKGNFDSSDGSIIILAGYHKEHDVFTIWDAGMYPEFSFSRNIQVRPEKVYEASAGRIATQERMIKGQGKEIVITCPSRKLNDALMLRMKLTRQRMLGDYTNE